MALHALTVVLLAAEDEPSRVPFYVTGALLAAWAVAVSVVGLRSPDFPADQQQMRGVIGVTVVLVLATLISAILTS